MNWVDPADLQALLRVRAATLGQVEQVKGTEKRTITYKYDPQGRRIEKRLVSVVGGTTKTSSWVYVYDNESIALEIYTNESGLVEKTWYTHGQYIDEPLALERSGQLDYYHADGLGSITVITDSARNKVQQYIYDSFGMPKTATGFRNTYMYTGREWDKETGLYYYRARYYDPMEGRFISKDPIGFKGGTNIYAYTDNNPINRTDPDGLFWLVDCGKCFYYMNQCAKEGLKCKKDKCKDADLPPTSDELFNACYKGIPACQKQLEYCGKCALSAQGKPSVGGK